MLRSTIFALNQPLNFPVYFNWHSITRFNSFLFLIHIQMRNMAMKHKHEIENNSIVLCMLYANRQFQLKICDFMCHKQQHQPHFVIVWTEWDKECRKISLICKSCHFYPVDGWSVPMTKSFQKFYFITLDMNFVFVNWRKKTSSHYHNGIHLSLDKN